MFHKLSSDYLSWILLIGAFFLLLDVFFFNRGVIFSLIVATGMIYLGRKWMPKMRGKLFFWLGIFFMALNALNMLSIKFFFLALIGVLFFQYMNRKKEPNHITPNIQSSEMETKQFKVQPLFNNTLFGGQKTPDHEYEWNDVNIGVGVGDTIIDLSYTVLPKGESVIFIRNIIGRITILVPYDIEVNINHSYLFGAVKILDYEEPSNINRKINIETTAYRESNQKVKILTSTMVGDIEVKRV